MVSCFNVHDGLFGPYPGADGHINYTFYCFQAAITFDLIDELLLYEFDEKRVADLIFSSARSLAQDSGIVYGD